MKKPNIMAKIKAKLKLKSLLNFKDTAKVMLMVRDIESMIERGDVIGMLKLMKPFVIAEGFDMKVFPNQIVYNEGWDAVVLLRKTRECPFQPCYDTACVCYVLCQESQECEREKE